MLTITGATGFIGRHLMRSLQQSGQRARILVRQQSDEAAWPDTVEVVRGSVDDPAAVRRLIEPGCTLVNLAFSHSAVGSDAVTSAAILADACVAVGIQRMIHCSTVSVYGRVNTDNITEETVCNPLSSYGCSKLLIEQRLRDQAKGKFELAILRPANIFGHGGEALVKVIHDLTIGNVWVNFARAVLFGERSSHLVSVESVVAAIQFLASIDRVIDAEIFNMSDDENPLNNFRDVEKILKEQLHISPYAVSPPVSPRQILDFFLWVRGRANVNSRTKYRCEKLMEWGFVKPLAFENALRGFAAQQSAFDGTLRRESHSA